MVPQYWGINYQPPDKHDAAPPFIGADMSIQLDEGGFCGDLTTAMGAVAGKCLHSHLANGMFTCSHIDSGAVNGVAGGIFSLLSLACQD